VSSSLKEGATLFTWHNRAWSIIYDTTECGQ